MQASVVLIEKQICSGMMLHEVISLLGKIEHDEFLPIEISGGNMQSSSMGFINLKFAEELDYDYEKSGLEDKIREIMAIAEPGVYGFKGHLIYYVI